MRKRISCIIKFLPQSLAYVGPQAAGRSPQSLSRRAECVERRRGLREQPTCVCGAGGAATEGRDCLGRGLFIPLLRFSCSPGILFSLLLTPRREGERSREGLERDHGPEAPLLSGLEEAAGSRGGLPVHRPAAAEPAHLPALGDERRAARRRSSLDFKSHLHVHR